MSGGMNEAMLDIDGIRVGYPVAGGFRKLSGNEMGCLLLQYILENLKKTGKLPAHPVAVKSIVSTPLADKVAAAAVLEPEIAPKTAPDSAVAMPRPRPAWMPTRKTSRVAGTPCGSNRRSS